MDRHLQDDKETIICSTFEEVDAAVDRVIAGETKLVIIASAEAEAGLGLYLQDSLIWVMENQDDL